MSINGGGLVRRGRRGTIDHLRFGAGAADALRDGGAGDGGRMSACGSWRTGGAGCPWGGLYGQAGDAQAQPAGDSSAPSPRSGDDRGPGRFGLSRHGPSRRRRGAAGLLLAAETILARLVQLGPLTGELLTLGRVDPLSRRAFGFATAPAAGAASRFRGWASTRFAAAGTAVDPAVGRAASLRVSAKVCGGAGLGVLAAVSVELVQLVCPARVGVEVLRGGVSI